MANIYETIFKKYGLSATQKEIIKIVGEEKIILEIGSSTGYMTQDFIKNGCIVDVLETDAKALNKLPKKVRKAVNLSVEDPKIRNLLSKDYNFIIMADILEHLINPQKVLKILYKIASKKTELIISMPNIASWVMRKQLFFKGDFEYRESGILDKTHLHFYTTKTLPKLLEESGWRMEKIIGTITYLPFSQSMAKVPILGRLFKRFIYPILIEKYRNLSYYHFLVLAYKK